jgi:polygalacturonase
MPNDILRRNFLFSAGAFGLITGLPSSVRPETESPGTVWRNVREFGASGDGKRADTRCILAAFDACASQGGGTVYFPAGKYLTGAIKLKSNIHLYLDSGATILGSQDPGDYPVYPSPWPDGTRQISSLIYGEDLVNVSILGRGVIDGQGRAWWVREWLRSQKRRVHVPSLTEGERREEVAKLQFGRPRLIRLVRCRNVRLEGVTLTNSPEWTINPVFCEYVTIDGVTILNPVPSPNTDGIDPESCRNVHISNCHIDVGDDCIAIKSGKDEIGRRVGKPCENITITNLTTARGHGGVSLGSEMSGGVRNIAISNCAFLGTQRGIRIKTQRGRGGEVEGVVAANIAMQDVSEAFTITMFYTRGDVESELPVDEGTPRFRNFYFSNITARGSKSAGQITGLREMPISSVALSNIRVDAARGFSCHNARDVEFHDVRIESAEGPALSAKNVAGLEIDGFHSTSPHAETPMIDLNEVEDVFVHGCCASRGTSTFLRVSGGKSSNIALRANNLGNALQRVVLAEGLNPAILSEK